MKTCSECSGERYIECERCEGKGQVFHLGDILTLASFDGWSECSRCSGTGKVICPECDGSGEAQENNY